MKEGGLRRGGPGGRAPNVGTGWGRAGVPGSRVTEQLQQQEKQDKQSEDREGGQRARQEERMKNEKDGGRAGSGKETQR